MAEYYVYLDDSCKDFDERNKAAAQINDFLSANYGGCVNYVAEFVNHIHVEIPDTVQISNLEKLIKKGFGFVTGMEAAPEVGILKE